MYLDSYSMKCKDRIHAKLCFFSSISSEDDMPWIQWNMSTDTEKNSFQFVQAGKIFEETISKIESIDQLTLQVSHKIVRKERSSSSPTMRYSWLCSLVLAIICFSSYNSLSSSKLIATTQWTLRMNTSKSWCTTVLLNIAHKLTLSSVCKYYNTPLALVHYSHVRSSHTDCEWAYAPMYAVTINV